MILVETILNNDIHFWNQRKGSHRLRCDRSVLENVNDLLYPTGGRKGGPPGGSSITQSRRFFVNFTHSRNQ